MKCLRVVRVVSWNVESAGTHVTSSAERYGGFSAPRADAPAVTNPSPSPEAARPAQPLPPLDELPRFGLSLSVDEAYAAVPHRRTKFDFDSAGISHADAEYLRRAFQTPVRPE